MAIVERRVQFKVKSEEKYREWEKKWEDVERRLGGYPPKRHMMLLAGADYVGTLVWEREWESVAAMEAAYEKLNTAADAQPLFASYESILEGERMELYTIE